MDELRWGEGGGKRASEMAKDKECLMWFGSGIMLHLHVKRQEKKKTEQLWN